MMVRLKTAAADAAVAAATTPDADTTAPADAAPSNAYSLYAMKLMKKDVLARRNTLRDAHAERDILAVLGGKLDDDDGPYPFIVRLYAAFQTKSRLYLVMDFAACGEIIWHLRRPSLLSEEHARFYSAELLVVFDFLQRR